VPARSRPGRPEAQPLLNHKRQSYGSCAYTALNGLSTLTCSYLTRTDLPDSADGYPDRSRQHGGPISPDRAWPADLLVAGPGFEPG